MQTELRVVNLGKRGGKVVRRFPIRGAIVGFRYETIVLHMYYDGVIDRPEAIRRLAVQNIPVSEARYLVELIDWLYLLTRKGVKNERHS